MAKTMVIGIICLFLVVSFVDIESVWKCSKESRIFKKLHQIMTSKQVLKVIETISIACNSCMKFIKEKIEFLFPRIICSSGGIAVKKPDWMAEEPWYKRIYRRFKNRKITVGYFCPEAEKKSAFELVGTKVIEAQKKWMSKVKQQLNVTEEVMMKGFRLLQLVLWGEIELDLEKCEDSLTKYLIDGCHVRRICPNGKIKVIMHLKDIYVFYLQAFWFILIMTILVALHLLLITPEEKT
ncbi:uncharacterized protein LOC111640989 [Centruroides sculpturatus]|uniref:uncharacterized protein LOC111640989 n=1 Tax=Centruroides sculpturatus TaxID=218467 RepID=UPI000C6D6758|nr:uncharacterized protein LOC111640989 [Centruroides sculpturatus]